MTETSVNILPLSCGDHFCGSAVELDAIFSTGALSTQSPSARITHHAKDKVGGGGGGEGGYPCDRLTQVASTPSKGEEEYF